MTEQGRFYIESIERIRVIEQDMDAFFSDIQQVKTGHLSVGSSSFYFAYFLAPLVKAFKRKYPGVHVDIRERNGEELKQWLGDETIDFLFGTALSEEKTVERTLLTHEYLILGVPAEFSVNERLQKFHLSVDLVRRNQFLQDELPEDHL